MKPVFNNGYSRIQEIDPKLFNPLLIQQLGGMFQMVVMHPLMLMAQK